MTITYSLGSMPKWVMINNVGQTAGGAKLYTYSSRTQLPKPVYQDPQGNFPYTNPIVFDENGTSGPFYWEHDSDDPTDLYYLEAYQSNGVPLWTIDNYDGNSSGGGGGGGTTYVNQKNLLANNLFYRNRGSNSSTPEINVSATTFTKIAPGAHSGFADVTASKTGADICFLKDNATSLDFIRFPYFNQGDDPFGADNTPDWMFQFECTSAGSETQKVIQFPINAKVNSLDNCSVTFVCWMRAATGTPDVNAQVRQFYGNKNGGADTFSTQQTCTLSTSWVQFRKTIEIDTAFGALGECGDDAIYLWIKLPLGVTNIFLCKPQLYYGTISPTNSFETFDEINSIISSDRTGKVQLTQHLNDALFNAPYGGYVALDDGQIGNASSGATSRANLDTFPLYNLLWNSVTESYCPAMTSAGAFVDRGVSAIEDFAANRRLVLSKTLGRALGASGTGSMATPFTASNGSPNIVFKYNYAASFQTGTAVQLTSSGTLPTPFLPLTTYYVVNDPSSPNIIKLASSLANSLLSTPVVITATGSGTGVHQISLALPARVNGQFIGTYEMHQTQSTLYSHVHPPLGLVTTFTGAIGGMAGSENLPGGSTHTDLGVTTGATGGNVAANIIDPIMYSTAYIKL